MQYKGIVIAAGLAIAYIIGTWAYTPDREHNGLRPGDSMKLRSISYVDTVASGEYQLWDLSGSEIHKQTKFTINSVSEKEDTLSCVVGRTRYIYSIAGDTVRYEGFENNLSDIMADKAENLLIFPLRFQTTFGGEFSGSGRYADRLRQEMRADYSVYADARGTLVTPEGDTIRNVLRLRTVRNIRDRYIPLKTSGENADSVSLREVSSRLYAEGYRYPLLICSEIYGGKDGKLVSATTYSMSTDEMESLDDPINEEVRQKTLSSEPNIYNNKDHSGGDLEPSIIEYSLHQDKSTGTMMIDFTTSENATVTFVLADIYGIVYSSETHNAVAGESYSVTLDYGKLPYSAAYGINITVGQEVHSEKFYR